MIFIGFSIALGCLPEFKGMTLLLNTPHTLETRFGGIMAALTWKPPH